MSVSGTLFGLEPNSQSRLNRKTVFIGTGAQIAAVPLTSPATMFLSTTTESGYVANELYVTKADGSGRAAVKSAHKHDAATDSAGGSIYDIDTANAGTRIAIDRLTKGGDFVGYREGAAALPTDGSRLDNAIVSNAIVTRLRTSTTTNNLTQLVDGGISLSFASKIEWRIKMEVSSSAAILFRAGVNMEGVDVASNATENKFGLEGCSSADTNLHIVCCNGSARTDTNVGYAMTGMRGYAMYYTPGTNIIWKDSTGNIQTMTSNVPSSGSIASDRMLRYGIKTTTTAEKAMYIARDCLFGRTADTLWVA